MNKVAEAVEPRRAAVVERAVLQAKQTVSGMVAMLEAAGWDLRAVAPYPESNLSRTDYKQRLARRTAFQRITRSVEKTRVFRGPELVAFDGEKVEAFYQDVAVAAGANFDSYVAKLTGKVGPITDAVIDSAPLWNGSTLTVVTESGETQKWRTQMILNVSSLGTMFNQWPTRRIA